MNYNFAELEAKWQRLWRENGTFRALAEGKRPKYYCLEMFPYPSGSGLHVGHLKNYVPTDAFCRFKSMQGFNVLHPMGWDAFGQPAENEAIRRGRNPRAMVPEYAATYRETLIKAGCSYDWEREINSSLPEYYKWTQWIFLLLLRKGLAYRATAPINWCPSCKTGLANEEVKDGRCWRCDTLVEKKPMPQWFFRITAYADRLLADLEKLNWSEGMKEMQRDWIGRSEGAEVDFAISGGDARIRVFTTRPDTLFGATFIVLAPEHPLVKAITAVEQRDEVDDYIRKAQGESEIDRLNAERAKTGVFTGAYAVNPVNGAKIPVWIADYVLMGYGTGAIMCVPGHDERDFAFANKFHLPVVQVVSRDGSTYDLQAAEPAEGIAVNSGPWSGLTTAAFKQAIGRWLEEKKIGRPTVNYRLRDWLISRQRYWGAPIPIVHCPACGEVPVPESELPVLLPEVENYQPTGTGESPLAAIPEFVRSRCPKCGGAARRETDTMGGYACSAWYFLRFADPNNEAAFASRSTLDYWLPVDVYTGGIEHARSHLLYARFWTKVLFDEGLLGFEEPFLTLRNQGSLLALTPGRRPRPPQQGPGVPQVAGSGNDEKIVDWIVLKHDEREQYPADQVIWRWARMSKSKGNVVTPDDITGRYGADSLRVYEMFVAPFEDNVQWSEEGIQGSHRFVARAWRWLQAALPLWQPDWRAALPATMTPDVRAVRRKLHQTVQKVGVQIESFQFNTALAAIMELLNSMYAYAPIEKEALAPPGADAAVVSELAETLILLLAPFAPHLGEEIWQQLGHEATVYRAPWPAFDPAVATSDSVTVMIQVNGKIKDKVSVVLDSAEEEVKAAALQSDKIKQLLAGRQIVKIIFVKNKMLSIVCKC
ncbi:MAG: leucine--tRNA ligase [Candidatus Aminicenantes bacterium]|nr:leucine--tRNA ligase [Candidatus Aminicenantes bacterium]